MLLDQRTSAAVWNVFPTYVFNIFIDIRNFHSSCEMVFWTNIIYAYVLSSVNLSWKCVSFLTSSNFLLLKSWRTPWKRLGHDKICFRTKWLIKTWEEIKNIVLPAIQLSSSLGGSVGLREDIGATLVDHWHFLIIGGGRENPWTISWSSSYAPQPFVG